MTIEALDFESFAARRRDVASTLAELAERATSLGARSLSGRVGELVTKVNEDKFHLVVVGEFNHGKSTFLNALLGHALLPVGVTPTTALVHHIEHAEEPSATVVRASGERQSLAPEAIAALVAQNDGAHDGIAHVELRHPRALWRDVVLVDTPGVNDLSLQRADITYGYIPRSDAVIFLLDAGQVLKESERVFLETKLVGQARDKIVFVVNKADLLDDEEREEARRYVHEHLTKLVPQPVVFFVSSLGALGADRARSGFPELVEHLGRFLAEERGRILLDNALGDGLAAVETLRKGALAKKAGLSMSLDELPRRIALLEAELRGASRTIEERRAFVREKVAAIKAWAKRDAERFRDDVVRQLPVIVDAASPDDLRVHFAPFLEETFREWAVRETDEIARALEALAEETIALVREDNRALSDKLAETLGEKAMKSPSLEVDTFAYDLGVSALFTIGVFVMFSNLLVGGVLTLAAPLLAVLLRERIDAEVKARAKEAGRAAIADAVEKVVPKLDEMLDDFAARLDEWVRTAGEEMHRQMLEVLSAALEERQTATASAAESLAACEREAERLEGVRERLEAMRGALWVGEGRER